MLLHLCFFHDVVVGVAHSATARSVADARGFAEVTTTAWNAASESLGNVTRVLSTTVAKSSEPQKTAQGQEVSLRQLTHFSRSYSAGNHVESVEASSCTALYATVIVVVRSRRVGESPKKKVKMSTVIDQQDETEVSALSRSQAYIYFQNHIDTAGAELLQEVAPSPGQIAAMKETLANRTRDHADFAVLTSVRMRNARVNEAEKLDSAARCHFQSHRCSGNTRFPRMVCVFQSLPVFQPSGPVGMSHKVVTCAALGAHLGAFCVLIGEFPECWHLLCTAEYRARRSFSSGQEGACQRFSTRKVVLGWKGNTFCSVR